MEDSLSGQWHHSIQLTPELKSIFYPLCTIMLYDPFNSYNSQPHRKQFQFLVDNLACHIYFFWLILKIWIITQINFTL